MRGLYFGLITIRSAYRWSYSLFIFGGIWRSYLVDTTILPIIFSTSSFCIQQQSGPKPTDLIAIVGYIRWSYSSIISLSTSADLCFTDQIQRSYFVFGILQGWNRQVYTVDIYIYLLKYWYSLEELLAKKSIIKIWTNKLTTYIGYRKEEGSLWKWHRFHLVEYWSHSNRGVTS